MTGLSELDLQYCGIYLEHYDFSCIKICTYLTSEDVIRINAYIANVYILRRILNSSHIAEDIYVLYYFTPVLLIAFSDHLRTICK